MLRIFVLTILCLSLNYSVGTHNLMKTVFTRKRRITSYLVNVTSNERNLSDRNF